MSPHVPEPGIGLFLGWQGSSNDVVNGPPRPYLTHLTVEAMERARWRASRSVWAWRGENLYMVSFVDPDTKIVFAQPDREESAARRTAWFAQDSEEWTFSDARSLARWLQLYAKYVDEKTPRSKLRPRLPKIWREYLDGQRAEVAPTALGLPRDPDEAFESGGWLGWEDWFWEPRSAEAKPDEAA
jgi:hypothetical protein